MYTRTLLNRTSKHWHDAMRQGRLAQTRRAYHPSVLPSLVSTASPEFVAKAEAMDALVADLDAKMGAVRQGGGPKAAERMRSRGKKLPRERCVGLVIKNGLRVYVYSI